MRSMKMAEPIDLGVERRIQEVLLTSQLGRAFIHIYELNVKVEYARYGVQLGTQTVVLYPDYDEAEADVLDWFRRLKADATLNRKPEACE